MKMVVIAPAVSAKISQLKQSTPAILNRYFNVFPKLIFTASTIAPPRERLNSCRPQSVILKVLVLVRLVVFIHGMTQMPRFSIDFATKMFGLKNSCINAKYAL